MAGLQKILKMYGSMKVNGVQWVWDYAKDEPRKKDEMTKEEIKASEKAKWITSKNYPHHLKINPPMEQKWFRISETPPPDGRVVMTKIDDGAGVRNVQPLKKIGNLWWYADGSMYVYYTPTHWQAIQ